MKKFLVSILLILLTSTAWALPPAPIPPIRATNCSAFIADGVMCYDTDDDKFYIGNGTAAVEFAGISAALTAGRIPYVTTGGFLIDSANLTYTDATTNIGLGGDLLISREAAATLQLGLDAAGITNQMLKGPDRITSDGVGGDLTIAAGRNRGASVGGSIIFQTSPAAGAGVTGTLATALTIDSTKLATFAGAITTTNITDSGLTITRVPFASTGGLLVDDANLTFATDTLSATKLISSTSITSPQIYGSSADAGTLTLTSTSHVNKGTISAGRLTLSDLANADGIVFTSLGTATKMIDGSSSGLSGVNDYWIYNSSTNFWNAAGQIAISDEIRVLYYSSNAGEPLMMYQVARTLPIISSLSALSPHLFGNWLAIGTLTGCSSNGTTTITKATHGLTLVAGELVYVTGSSTAADKGFYRYVSGDANTIVVDRVLSGTQTDVALVVYKDVISIHATDATNGQMLTSWSAQNKPLQIGGTVLAATTNLDSADVYIGGDIGFSQTQAASNQVGTLTTVHTAGNPGIYLKVNVGGTWYAIPGWAIP